MIKVFLCIYAVLFNRIHAQQMELIAGHVLFRHGDRTPISTYPTDPMKESDWPNGFGQLTTVGIQQQYRLGKYFRQRYQSILNKSYVASEIYVRATDYDRTLMSAQANLAGLYVAHKIRGTEIGTPLIPIHTESKTYDHLLGEEDCPRLSRIIKDVYESDEMANITSYFNVFLKNLETCTQISPFTMAHAAALADTIFIEHLYKKAPSWANETVRKNLTIINDFIFRLLYSNEDIKRIRGGPLVQDVWTNMKNAHAGRPYQKLRMYSAHDSTVSAVLAFLGIDYQHQPPYASAVFFDLYRQNSTYYVKVEYLNVTDSSVSYPHVLDGCPGVACPLDTFTKLYEPRCPSSVKDECDWNALPAYPRDDKKRTLLIVLIVLVVCFCLIVAGAIFYCYCRSGGTDDDRSAEMNTPLLKDEKTSH